MSCHLAGSDAIVNELRALAGDDVHIGNVSCFGRCDRASAACIIRRRTADDSQDRGSGELTEESYYLARSAAELSSIIVQCLEGSPPRPDYDADLSYTAEWEIDAYKGELSDYAAVKKALAVRDESLKMATEILQAEFKWTRERSEQFRFAAVHRLVCDSPLDQDLVSAVRAWQTAEGWAAKPELGGWSDVLLQELDDPRADLRGMGGAGIPASRKWADVRNAVRTARRRHMDDRAFIIVNGDESEPGTFKDRELLLRAPHVIVEGVILAGLVTEATEGFIYIRHEYAEQIRACEQEIQRAEALGMCGSFASALGHAFPVSVFVSPGGYICGEQSALIETMSDRRGEPRNMPPSLETNGLDDRPTLVSNVETYAWVPYIWLRGGQQYASLGVNGCRGRRFFSVSGDVERPGVYEVPMGMTLRDLIYGTTYCGGIKDGRKLKAFAPSGPSGGFLPAQLITGRGLPEDRARNRTWQEFARRHNLDVSVAELDILEFDLELNVFRGLSPTQALGAGLVVYAEHRNMASEAVNSLQFFRNESCGKCVPCRIGSQKLATLGSRVLERHIGADQWRTDLVPLVKELADVMTDSSICGLGRSVRMPLMTLIDFFEADLLPYINGDVTAKTEAGQRRELSNR